MDILRKLFKNPGPPTTITWEPAAPAIRGTLADRYFEVWLTEQNLEEELWSSLFQAIGYDYPGELGDLPDGTRGFLRPWPLQDITFDHYDSSFEFKGCSLDWTPTPEQLDACLALGFSCCWVCWVDGTESYYNGRGTLGPRRKRGGTTA